MKITHHTTMYTMTILPIGRTAGVLNVRHNYNRIKMPDLFKLFFIYLLNLLSLNAQVLNSGITNRYQGSGNIGKYEIEFTLDVIVSPYYEKGDHVGEIQQFSGRYYYESQNKNIYLWGTRKITFFQGMRISNDSIKLYEVDESFNKVAIFEGLLKDDSFSGLWSKIDNKMLLPFNIKFNQSNFTLLEIKTSKGNVILPFTSMSDYINKYNQNEYRLIKIIEKNNKTYVLISLSFTVCGAIKTRGQGCGGHNVFLRLYEISKNGTTFSEVKTDGYPILSTSESLNKNEYKVSVSTSSFQDEITKEYIVNFNEPYKGIQEIKR